MNKYWSTEINKTIPINFDYDNTEAITIIDLLENNIKKYKNLISYRFKKYSYLREISWLYFYNDCKILAKVLIKNGLKRFDGVVIHGFNCYEWIVIHIATILAGGISVGVYTTNSKNVCKYILNNSDSKFVFVENILQLEKYLDNDLNIEKIIVWSNEKLDRFKDNKIPIVSFSNFMKDGFNIYNDELDNRMKSQKPNNVHSLIYTSGTTGFPKGVMITHDNIIWISKKINKLYNINSDDRIVSYLPLSHVAAQLLDIYCPIASGANVTFADRMALKGTLGNTLRFVKPTIFFGVPRVWQKIMDKIKQKSQNSGIIKKFIGNYAKSVALSLFLSKENGKVVNDGILYTIFDYLVYSKVKTALGLEECRNCLTGAAPISKDVLEFFFSLGIPIYNLYGSSECSGPCTLSLPESYKISINDNGKDIISAGRSFTGEEVKIDENTGEILYKGRHIFTGYLKDEEQTKRVFDKNGYYHSGDIGKFDNDGFLMITGRIKEIIIGAGGENIAPVFIENNIKKELPILSNVVTIGDNKKYLTVLITLKCKQNYDGTYSTRLEDSVKNELKKLSIDANTVNDIIDNNKFNNYILDGIFRSNQNAISRAQTIKKYRILLNDFSIETGELTPTMKLKRSVIVKKYKDIIDDMYN